MRHWTLIALLSALVIGCGLRELDVADSAPGARGTVVKVTDGDTVQVRLESGKRVKVRVFGIDAPEASATRFGQPDCGGRAATNAMRRLVLRRRVSLRSDSAGDSVDRYGRWLRYVGVGDRDAGRELVAAGLAEVYRFRGQRFDRARSYDTAAEDAEDARRGVHATCGGDFHSSRGG